MPARLLDLFCGAGGASAGYHRAGFEVTGVDRVWQRRYPYQFKWSEALYFLRTFAVEIRHTYDVIHASPPCQDYSTLTQGNRMRADWWDEHEDLIGATRAGLQHIGIPWVLENVPASWIRPDIELCGEMFDLGVIRHRYFEIGNWKPVDQLAHREHRGPVRGWRHGVYVDGPYLQVYGSGGGKGTVEQWRQAMGIDWPMTRAEIAEAIPPAYTEWIGGQLLKTVWAPVHGGEQGPR
jgi:C-5 cytosine-specific DNA methylase